MFTRRTFLAAVASGLAAPQVTRAATPKRLVFVHGRAQGGRDPSAIRAEWTSALAAGAAAAGHTLSNSIDIALPFYGDVLDEMTAAVDLPLTSEITTKGDECRTASSPSSPRSRTRFSPGAHFRFDWEYVE